LLRGYGSTSVDNLSSATGLGKGSLYGAFGDKHGLFMRVLDEYVDAHLNNVRTLLRDTTYAAYDRLNDTSGFRSKESRQTSQLWAA